MKTVWIVALLGLVGCGASTGAAATVDVTSSEDAQIAPADVADAVDVVDVLATPDAADVADTVDVADTPDVPPDVTEPVDIIVTPDATSETGGGAQVGEPCMSVEDCAAGLACCYPCGIPGCKNKCQVPCTGPGCPNGCMAIP